MADSRPHAIIGIGLPRSVQEMMSRSDRNAITAVPPMKRGRHRRKGQVGANKMLALPSILANRPGTCRIVPENEVPSCSPGNNAKCPAILITLGQRPSFVLLSYIYIHLDLGYSTRLV